MGEKQRVDAGELPVVSAIEFPFLLAKSAVLKKIFGSF